MRSSAGEHLVDIEGVTGSIPVTSTIFHENPRPRRPGVPGWRTPVRRIATEVALDFRTIGMIHLYSIHDYPILIGG